ncbi:sensor domain-containing diguanylate cyclase [Butyrivibrio sp. CB08]|uniref:GGDEF domain-containing protein n=1 Tax=Butyrivibrio sp. CB08 TaxID=2364879 RepID=UPI000EA9FF1E|nr:GGDEF domain-containing protein [Butyrivibrio sp. CB08]RKM55968.1 sensor domain-containing diguanylate cyclase [Butyrivibrio sp. CB08]
MSTVLTATDLVASLFIFTILMGLYRVPREALKSTRLFRNCLWFCLVGLIVETVTYTLDGQKELSTVLLLLNYLGFVLIDLIVCVYGFYMCALIAEREQNFSRRFAFMITFLCVLDVCFITIGTITGRLFSIQGGYFTKGPWYGYIDLISGLCFFLMVILYATKYKYFWVRSYLFLVLIVIVPTFAIIIRNMDSAIKFNFVGTAVSMNVVYVVIQSRIILDALVDVRINKEISVKDALTGLMNRRGYLEILDGISEDETVGIVFSDVNSLKEVNDTQGHAAGDKLIIRAANLLSETVPEGTTCRISGDEFVCIVRNVDKTSFDQQMEKLRKVIMDNDWFTSIGYEFGEGGNIKEVIKVAENKMYDDKERYYLQTGKDRRR